MTAEARQAYLQGLREGMTAKGAAAFAGHPYDTFNAIAQREPGFRELKDLAMAEGGDVMLAEAQRRAVDGVLKPVIGKVEPGIDGQLRDAEGNLLWEQVYSDKLLEMLVKGRKPEYRENRGVEITNQTLNVTVEDRSAALADVARVLQEAGVSFGEIGDGRGGARQELPVIEGVLAEPSDV